MHRDKFVATYNMTSHRTASIAALLLVLMAGAAAAQDRSSGGFLDNLFKRGEGQAEQPQQAPPPPTTVGQEGPVDSNNVGVRIDRIENSLRQLTGTLEQLQYQNQQLQMQLKRMQDDTEYRLQQLGSKGAAPTAGVAPRAMAPQTPAAPMSAPVDAAAPGRRSDAFDPSRQPNAPGAPRALGNEAVAAPLPDNAANVPPVGAPDGRAPGAPLDLSTLAANPIPQAAPVAAPPGVAGAQPRTAAPASGVQLATLPPSASPQDEYDMAYGYVLHKDYPLAEQAFRDFLATAFPAAACSTPTRWCRGSTASSRWTSTCPAARRARSSRIQASSICRRNQADRHDDGQRIRRTHRPKGRGLRRWS